MIKLTYYLEVTSSWCYWAEPAWAELKRRYAGQVEFAAATPRHVALDVATRRWPMGVAGTGLSVLVDSRAKLDVDAVEPVGQGGRAPGVMRVAAAPVTTKPLSSVSTQPCSQRAFGSAPMNRNRCRSGAVLSAPVRRCRKVAASLRH